MIFWSTGITREQTEKYRIIIKAISKGNFINQKNLDIDVRFIACTSNSITFSGTASPYKILNLNALTNPKGEVVIQDNDFVVPNGCSMQTF